MAKVQNHLYVLILAGGGGTRLWPMSRDASPKQFAKLFGGKSLLELTFERAKKIVPPSHIFISTSSKYLAEIRKEANAIPSENIIAEPMRRDTAMAMGLAALYIYNRDPQAVIINLASDHLVKPPKIYIEDLKSSAKIAFEQQAFVVIGVKPRYPHTGYGHIQVSGKNLSGGLKGKKFVEKPALPLAQRYTKSPNYYWNISQYTYPAKLYLDLLKKHSPKTCAMFPKILEAIGTDKERQTISLAFQMAPTISIDYAVSEKLNNFVLFPARFFWTDIGDWNEIWKNLDKDQLGNVIQGTKGQGEYIGLNSKNNLLFLDKQLVVTVGLENMLVIDTPDALLICPKDDSQSVKKIVEMLKIQKLEQYL